MNWFRRKTTSVTDADVVDVTGVTGGIKMELDTFDQEANRIANSVHKQVFGDNEQDQAERFDVTVQEAFLLLMRVMDNYPAPVVRMAVLSYICNWEEITVCDCQLCESVNNVIQFVKAEQARIIRNN